MTKRTLSYSFEFDGTICGKMDVHMSPGYVRTVTEFETIATGRVLAEFEVFFNGLDVVKARKHPFDWMSFADQPRNALPDCAYQLLIERSQISDFEYLCVDLERDRDPKLHQVSRTNNEVVEMQEDRVLRRFLIDEDIPTWIDWGGASSSLL